MAAVGTNSGENW